MSWKNRIINALCLGGIFAPIMCGLRGYTMGWSKNWMLLYGCMGLLFGLSLDSEKPKIEWSNIYPIQDPEFWETKRKLHKDKSECNNFENQQIMNSSQRCANRNNKFLQRQCDYNGHYY
jgi:hypothetical protein